MIWMTPFNPDTMKCTGNSTPTDFTNLKEAEDAHGAPLKKTDSYIVYEEYMFSYLRWNFEETPSFL